MKKTKRMFSTLLAIVFILGTIAVGMPYMDFFIKASALNPGDSNYNPYYVDNNITTGKVKENADGSFVTLQIGDLQMTYVPEDVVGLMRHAMARVKPNLVVFTGDNAMYTNGADQYENLIKQVVSYLYDSDGYRIPFAITFGNHDVSNNTYSSDNGGGELGDMIDFHKTLPGYIDYEYSKDSIGSSGTGCVDVYNANGTAVKQKVIIINSAVDGPSGDGYGKVGYYQASTSRHGYDDEPAYYNAVLRIAQDVEAGVPTIAFQHIPLREMYTSGILANVAAGTAGALKAYSDIQSDLTLNGSKVTDLYFKPASDSVGEYYESVCCSYNTTEALYCVLANHSTTKTKTYNDGSSDRTITFTAHQNVYGIFYGHDHSDTVTGYGAITVDGETYSLRQGYGGGLDIGHSGSNKIFFSAYKVYSNDAVAAATASNQSNSAMTTTVSGTTKFQKYTWDSETVLDDYDTTFGAKYTINGYSGNVFVNRLGFGLKGQNIFYSQGDLMDDALDKAVSGYSLGNSAYGCNTGGVVRLKWPAQESYSYTADLNNGSGGDYLACAYDTTTKYSTPEDMTGAYTDLVLLKWTGSGSPPATLTKDKFGTSVTYSLVTTPSGGYTDMNESAGGDYIYVYGSRDPKAGIPITALGIVYDSSQRVLSKGIGYYMPVTRSDDNAFQFEGLGDFNSGCGSSTYYVFMLTKTIGSASDHLNTTTTSAYDITYQYYDLAKLVLSDIGKKVDSYRYETSAWSAYQTALNNAKALKTKIDNNRYITESRQYIVNIENTLINAYNDLENHLITVDESDQTNTGALTETGVQIAVPETVYLTPSTGASRYSQYFLNNTISSGTLVPNGTKGSTGNLYIKSNVGTTSVTVKATRYDTSNGTTFTKDTTNTLTVTDSNSRNIAASGGQSLTPSVDKICTATISQIDLGSRGLTPKQSCLIEWEFNVTLNCGDIEADGVPETVTNTYYAYTTVYAQNAGTTASVGAMNHTKFEANERNAYSATSVWITGLDGYNAESHSGNSNASITQTYSKTINLPYDPMTSLSSYPSYPYTTSSGTYYGTLSEVSGGNTRIGWNATTSNTYHNITSYVYSQATGYRTIDSSRYTRLIDVPYFNFGTDINGLRTANEENDTYRYGYYYSTGYDTSTQQITDSSRLYLNLQTNKSDLNSLVFQCTAASPNNSGFSSPTINTSNTKFTAISFTETIADVSGWGSGDWWRNQSTVYAFAQFTYVNKQGLRTSVGNAVNAGYQKKWDTTSSSFDNMKAQLMADAYKLGIPTDTTASSSTLDSRRTTCGNNQVADHTGVIYRDYGLRIRLNNSTGAISGYDSLDITPNSNNSKDIRKNNWFYVKAATIDGYTFAGLKRNSTIDFTSNPTIGGFDEDSSFTKYKSEFTASSAPYAVSTNFYYTMPNYTLTIDINGGSGFSYTTVTGNQGSTITLPTISRAGYTFAGWTMTGSGTLSSASSTSPTYTFGTGNCTLVANWNANSQTVTINPDGGIFNGNIAYFMNGASSVTYNDSSYGYNYNIIYDSNSNMTITGHTTGNKYHQEPNLCAYLEYGKTYRVSYDSTVNSSNFFLYIGSIDKRSGRINTYTYDSATGIYHFEANIRVGYAEGNDTAGERRWQNFTSSELTGVYYFRVDQATNTDQNFSITNFKIVPTSDATVKITQKTDETRLFSKPTKYGYLFDGFAQSPSGAGYTYDNATLKFGHTTATLTALWDECVISYNINHNDSSDKSIEPNVYALATSDMLSSAQQTQNGITYSYDKSSNIVTLNGTSTRTTQGSVFSLPITDFDISEGTYRFTITKLSGSFNGPGNNTLSFELKTSAGANLSSRIYKDFVKSDFDSQDTVSKTITVSDVQAGQVEKILFHSYANDVSSTMSFSNFRFRIKVEKIETNTSSNYSLNARFAGDSYSGCLPSPYDSSGAYSDVNFGCTTDAVFLGWSRSVDGSTGLVCETDEVTKSHTLYAQWDTEVSYNNIFDMDDWAKTSTLNSSLASGSEFSVDYKNNSITISRTNTSNEIYITGNKGAYGQAGGNAVNLVPGHSYRLSYNVTNNSGSTITSRLLFTTMKSSSDSDTTREVTLNIQKDVTAGQTRAVSETFSVGQNSQYVVPCVRFGCLTAASYTIVYDDVKIEDITNPEAIVDATVSTPDNFIGNVDEAYSLENVTTPFDGYIFGGWYDSIDANGNGTGTKIGDAGTSKNLTVYDIHAFARWMKVGVQIETTPITISANEFVSNTTVAGALNGWESRVVTGYTTTAVTTDETNFSKRNVTVRSSGTETLANGTGKVEYSATGIKFDPSTTIGDTVNTIYAEIKSTYDGRDYYTYAPIKVVPQTTILFDQNDAGTFTNGTASWTQISSESITGSQASRMVYGYSKAYINDSYYSGGTQKVVTVSNGQSSWPTYTYEFKGTGCALYATCYNESGLMTVKLEKKNGSGVYETVSTNAINTFYKDGNTNLELYQAPVYTKTDLDYGMYRVTVTAVYSYYFDNTDNGTVTASLDENAVQNGDMVDLSAELGSEYASCEYFSMNDGENSSTDELNISDYESAVVGARNLPTSVSGSYNICIDGVRIYNPAGKGATLTNTTIKEKYISDEELDPTFYDIRTKLGSSLTLGNGNIVYLSKYNDVSNNTTTDWSVYSTKGANHEVLLNAGGAIAFTISDYDGQDVHISLRSPRSGQTPTVSVNSNTLPYSITSATDQYFDITDYITSNNGVVLISCTSGMVSVGSLKLVDADSLTLTSTQDTVDLASEMLLDTNDNPVPEKSDVTFNITIGDKTVQKTVTAERLSYVETADGWKLTAKLTESDVKEILTSAGLDENCRIKNEDDIELTALYDGEKWVAQDVSAELEIAGINDLLFNVTFVNLGNTAIRIPKDRFTVTQVDGKTIATAEITNDELVTLMNDVRSRGDYALKTNGNVTVKAEFKDGEWQTEDVKIEVQRLGNTVEDNKPAKTLSDIIKNFFANIFKGIFSKLSLK